MSATVSPARRGVRLGGLLVRPGDFYATVDLATAQRIGGVTWIVTAAIVLVLLPFAPPTHHIGNAGWAVVGVELAATLGLAWLLLRTPARVSPDQLMAMSCVALAQVTLLQWLGGERAPYTELLLITAVYTAATHPPRRVIVYLVALTAAASAPLVYAGWDRATALQTFTSLLLWIGLSVLAALFASIVRMNRVGLRKAGEAAREQARLDALTSLGNRRAFDEAVAGAIAGARRVDRPFSIVIADVAGFKRINDTFGHLEGDRCLRAVAEALRATVRAPDACFRWGGDEFALVLGATDRRGADRVGERLRAVVERTVELPSGDALRVRWGAAEFREGMDAAQLMATADLALMGEKAGEAAGSEAGHVVLGQVRAREVGEAAHG